MIRGMGLPYVELEKEGIAMPVYSVESKYRNVLKYDELITIETIVKDLPTARIEFYHRIYNQAGELAHEAKIILVFMDIRTSKVVRAPEKLVNVLKSWRPTGSEG